MKFRMGQFKSCTWGGISSAPVQVEANGLESSFVEKAREVWVATKLNTRSAVSPGRNKGQQPPGLHYRVQPASQGKGSLPLTQLWGDTSGVLDPLLCFPVQERHGQNETSLVKYHRFKAWSIWNIKGQESWGCSMWKRGGSGGSLINVCKHLRIKKIRPFQWNPVEGQEAMRTKWNTEYCTLILKSLQFLLRPSTGTGYLEMLWNLHLQRY